jgi:hypothetical protein
MPTRFGRWYANAQTRTVQWTNVLLAQILAGLCLATVAVGFYVRQEDAQSQAQQAQYETNVNEWKRCQDRVASTHEIDAVNKAGVAHAEDTARTLDQIVAVAESAGATNERLVTIRGLVDKYQASVIKYRDAADAFVPQDPAKCPPMPNKPGG